LGLTLTAAFVAGFRRYLLQAVSGEPALLPPGATLPEAPLSDAQDWGEGEGGEDVSQRRMDMIIVIRKWKWPN
jgi:hypothetical protein